MKSAALIALSCLFTVFFASCATDEEEKTIPIDKTGKTMEPKLVGRVASLPSDRRFVLIESYGKWQVSSGSILTTRGKDNRVANLLVTGEVMGQYAAADVQAGELEVGDAVYSREMHQMPATPAPPEPIDTKATRPF